MARTLQLATTLLVLLLACTLLHAAPFDQPAHPITFDGLLKALKIGGLSTSELVEQVNKRGVDFDLTNERESQLRSAGAQPELLLAIAKASRALRSAPEPQRNALPQSPGPNYPRSGGDPPVANTPPPRPAAPQVRLGVQAGVLTQEQRQAIKYQGDGLIILSIQQGSLAAEMLMQRYDILVAVNGVAVYSPEQLIALMSAMRPGQEVSCKVMRGRVIFRKTVWDAKLLTARVPGNF